MAKRRTDKEIRFEDVPKLTDREIQLLLREVDTRDLAMAMNRSSKA